MKNEVKNILTTGYNGARTVGVCPKTGFFIYLGVSLSPKFDFLGQVSISKPSYYFDNGFWQKLGKQLVWKIF